MLWLLKGLGEGTGRRPAAKGEMLISSFGGGRPKPILVGVEANCF